MKIIIQTGNEAVIEIDLDTQTLTTALPVPSGTLGEILVESGEPPIVHLTLPFGQVGQVEAAEVKIE